MYVQKVDIKFDVKPKFQTILPTPVKLEISSPPKYNFRLSTPVAEIKAEVIDLDIEEIDDDDDDLFGLDEMDSLTKNKSGNSIPQLTPNPDSDGFDAFPHFSPPHEQSDFDNAENSTQIINSPQPTESIDQQENEMTNLNQLGNETSNANQEQTETNSINQPEKEIKSEINSSTNGNREISPKKKKKGMYMKTKRASVDKPLIFKNRQTTTQEIKKRADQGDPFAMYQYGISMYYPGIDSGIPDIYNAAIKKQPDAMYWLAIHYLNSFDGFTCDLRQAYKFLRSAAHRKHLLAQFSFGFYMENGVRIQPMRKSITGELIADKKGFVWPIDLRRGFKYLKKAANKNHPMAAYLIARKYETGIDTVYQISKSHDKASTLVDNIHFVVPQDDALCTKYYRVAAINGNLPSMIKYAERANNGIGMEPDYLESAFFLKKASLSDDQVALYNYGVHLYKGTAGLTSNLADSLENLLKSAKKGYQPAAKFLLEIIKSHPDEIGAIQNDIPNIKKLASE